MFWTTAAYAMADPNAAAGGGGASGLTSFVPLILMFAVFYFLLIRPQQKRAKEQRAMISALKRGDDVITAGGLYGRIVETADEYVVLDLGDSKVKVSRTAISGVPVAPKAVDKKAKKEDKKEGQ